MATLTKRKTGWQVQVRKGDVETSKSFQTKGQASAWAAQIELEIEKGKYQVKSGRTLQDLLDRFKLEGCR